MANVYANIITIGDELLIGQTIDTNSAWIAQRLNDLGILVRRRVAVADDAKAIHESLDAGRKDASLLIITGGLGPTADDITKPVLCEYFGGKMVFNEAVFAQVETIFKRRNLPMLERNRKQAEVPDVCTVLPNKLGTAPGMLFSIEGQTPEQQTQWVISLPGVPHEMMGIMEQEVIPRLRHGFTSDAVMHRSVLTAGLGESFIAERIADLEKALPDYIRLAYLPSNWVVKLRLTAVGKDSLRLSQELHLRVEEIANRLDDVVVALEDSPLELIIGKRLIHHGKKLALAESCTGGEISDRITNVLGSSQYFQGAIVCYQNEVKQQLLSVSASVLEEQGAVCESVACEMAVGARKVLCADYGFGVTGLLSSGGDERVPVGTVWMAVADAHRIVSKHFHFPYDRIRNKEVAVQMGLLHIWRMIDGKI